MALIHSKQQAERIARLNGMVKEIKRFPCVSGPRPWFYVLYLTDGTKINESYGL